MKESVTHYSKIFLNLLIALVTLLAIIFLLPKVVTFFMPFLVGWIIALLANPLVRFLEEHLKIRRKAGSAVTIVIVIGLVALLLYGIGNFLAQQTIGFIDNLPEMWESLGQDLNNVGNKLQIIYNRMSDGTQQQIDNVISGIREYSGNVVGRLSSPTVEWVGNVAMNVPGLLIGVIMGLLSAYFFVAEKVKLSSFMKKYMPQSVQNKWGIICSSLKQAFGGYLLAQLKIEIWMYLLLVIGLSLAKANYVVLVALGIACLDLLPVFGTGTVLVPWALLKIVGGDYTTAIILLVLWGGGQLLRQLIQPHIVGDSLGMPPIPTLFLLFFGWRIAGVGGMILAVPIGLVFVNLYKAGVFDTTRESLLMLIKDINAFRTYTKEDYEYHEKYLKGNAVDRKEKTKHTEKN